MTLIPTSTSAFQLRESGRIDVCGEGFRWTPVVGKALKAQGAHVNGRIRTGQLARTQGETLGEKRSQASQASQARNI